MENDGTHIIKPQQQTSEETTTRYEGDLPQELLDIGLNLDNMQIIDHLGLKDVMFHPDTMPKVNDISDYLKTSGKDIEMVDLQLGNPGNMSRLDKIYSYVQLEKQSADIKRREALINKEKSKYDTFKRFNQSGVEEQN
ncbi:MAG: hypothetical protein VKQ33_16650 [Candidatus Sericytochromatia bacterium]|nr:hypothetical protein [Candidatus Sericytochromatia bacterium]